MVHSSTAKSSSTVASEEWNDPRVDVTFNAVDWDTLLGIACKHCGVRKAQWGEQKSGGYNLVRFLHLDDEDKTIVVARVPLHPEEGASCEHMRAFCDRVASEVATMQYVEMHTSIPVPHVIHYSTETEDNGVRSPFVIMSKVVGTPLCDIWNEMLDDKRDTVLRQVVDILLELASHRFDKIGALFKGEGTSKEAWYVGPLSAATDISDLACAREVSKKAYTSGTDYWVAFANAHLKIIAEEDFGARHKVHDYAHAWFLRSLVPALIDPSLDESGFPLLPGDFHSQNVLIVDADSSPRISSVIDWEFSATTCTSSFAQYPLFIVDHPMWEDDHPLRPRNVRDQAAFNKFVLEAEQKRDPTGDQPLSRAFAGCFGAYLFQQCIQNPTMFDALYPQMFAHVFGDDAEDEFSGDYYWALMENGILRKETKQFDFEVTVREEADSVLGDELAERTLIRSEFTEIAKANRDRFPEGGKVREWLHSLEQTQLSRMSPPQVIL